MNDYIMKLQYLNEVNEFDTFERSNKYLQNELNENLLNGST